MPVRGIIFNQNENLLRSKGFYLDTQEDSMASEDVVILNEENFENEVINASVPVLVDFWAVWCGPCSMIAPVVDEIAKDMKGKVKVGKVNVDESPGLAGKYGIRAIPTLLIFKNGQVVDQIIGVQPKNSIVAALTRAAQ